MVLQDYLFQHLSYRSVQSTTLGKVEVKWRIRYDWAQESCAKIAREKSIKIIYAIALYFTSKWRNPM